MGFSRRQFLGGGLALGGALATGAPASILRGLGIAKEVNAAPVNDQEKISYSCCNPECNNCSLQVHVRNGKLVRISPNPNYYTRPCLRGRSRLQWNYHPDRLKYPFKRVGERGEGKWERISWEEALDTIATKLGQIRDESGPESVWFTAGAVMSVLPNSMQRRFANAFGKGVMTGGIGSLCCAAQGEASTATQGYRTAGIEEKAYSKLLIAWGHNPAVTYIPHSRIMADALDKGCRLITIDPRFSETASKADKWISIKPGTDTAMAMAMIRIIIEENLYDEKFALGRSNLPFLVNEATGKLLRQDDVVAGGDHEAFVVWDQSTNGPALPNEAVAPVLEGTFKIGDLTVRTVFARLRERVAKFTPEYASEITGVPAEDISEVAYTYATVKPAMIDSGMSGAQRTSSGAYFVQSLLNLAGLTGNIGLLGGGVNDTGGFSHGTNVAINAPFKADNKGVIPATKVGEYLSEGKPYPIRAIYWQGKGMGQLPNTNKVVEGFKKMDFIVVQEHFFGDAASLADIVLPVATLFERYDVMCNSRSFYYHLMDKAIEPFMEAQSDGWIYTELAKRLGFGEYFDKTEEEWIDVVLEQTGLTVESLRKSGPVYQWSDPKLNKYGVKWDKKPFTFFVDTPFKTASGRFEFHASRWEDKGFEPLVNYFPPEESKETAPELYEKYPLSLVANKIRTKVHSTYAIMPWLSEIYPKGWVTMSTVDAEARGIKDGDMVEVFNDRGSVKVTAHVGNGIRPGVVSMPNGWWMQQGYCSSVLSNDYTHPQAYGHALNSTLVQVKGV
ncbi:anaerobic dehydrogenase, typically selenocysteine-containing [Desulfitobacterium dichloroeliminans LMG P-21439]|uniref:Anaerobic dehydrogenase, typically selenocysteine-containing n=1 Tax=Desulfitobacterium dichloroeliminans (strain LMG P-21439 / DCA1) TaxID=871963 RepID=L0F880_DESDL|nr:molybdopterin-dependent oxidoreductase [Desulfitobacterium dichloroeliminans]AGA69153.1 anaerobic dehydrogenase, typically selenocysteine-containing [Desulfitobacterium dichloroeliminans LMG P-21439]